jgi:UDP-glucose 4-epimerase
VLNIGGGKPRSYKDALDIISKILNKKIEINSKPRTTDPVDKIYDLKLIKELFSDFKFTSLEQGLELTYKKSI